MLALCVLVCVIDESLIYSLQACLQFFSAAYIFKTLHTNPRIEHTKQNASVISCIMKLCIQNITNASQKQTFAITFAILIPVRFVCVT